MKPSGLKSKIRGIMRPFLPLAALGLAVGGDVREGNLRLRAAALTYVTLLSLAPLLAICFSALKAIGIHNQLEPFLLDFLAPLGEQGAGFTKRMVGFVDNIKVGVLGLAGVLVLAYGVLAMMREIERAFNDIWQVKRGRTLLRRIRDYPGVLLVVPLLMSVSVLMAGVLRYAALAEKWLGIHIPGGVFEAAGAAVSYALFVLSFTALYLFMPNARVRPLPALLGGVAASVLWKALGWLFGAFVAGSGSYAAIYSVFAAMMLFMVWINIGWLIVLVGASLSYHIQNRSMQA